MILTHLNSIVVPCRLMSQTVLDQFTALPLGGTLRNSVRSPPASGGQPEVLSALSPNVIGTTYGPSTTCNQRKQQWQLYTSSQGGHKMLKKNVIRDGHNRVIGSV